MTITMPWWVFLIMVLLGALAVMAMAIWHDVAMKWKLAADNWEAAASSWQHAAEVAQQAAAFVERRS